MGNTISYNTTPHDLSLGEKGTLRGLQFNNKARRYAGVPYALAPTGDFRWRKPRPLPPSYSYIGGDDEAPFDATKFKAVCPQKTFHMKKADTGDGHVYSEDCLFVNIWTPVEAEQDKEKDKKWPVMLWLHGGWFQMGDPSHEQGMDPTELISTGRLNAIVVAIGYRLNVFGFLAGKTLREDNLQEAGGNFGLWDQRLATEWVKSNIGFFGGDADNITLAGRSAGAYSVEAQMLYDFRRPDAASSQESLPFHRVFMCSNAIPAQPKTLKDAESQFEELCAHFKISEDLSGAEKLAKLRGISHEDLIAGIQLLKQHTFRPVTDAIFIHPGMYEYLQSKTFASEFTQRKLRLLIGEVRNEETLYATYNSPEEASLEALQLQISNYYAPDTTARALKEYTLPESDNVEDWKNLFGRIISDGQMRAPSRVLVRNLVAHGASIKHIWRYQVAYRLSFIDETVAPRSFGVAHAMDKPFWNFSICHGPTADERRLMEDWAQIIVAFVNNDEKYEFGTSSADQMKVATPEGTIEVRNDVRWDELVGLGEIFGGG